MRYKVIINLLHNFKAKYCVAFIKTKNVKPT